MWFQFVFQNCYWKLKEIKTITIQRICHLYYCINVLCLVGVFSNKQQAFPWVLTELYLSSICSLFLYCTNGFKGLYRSYTNSRVVQLVPIVYCLYKKIISINVSISTFFAKYQWKVNNSYNKGTRNKSTRGTAQLEPIGMPAVCCKIHQPNITH
jgi:hypothetical protein